MHNKGMDDLLLLAIGIVLSLLYIFIVVRAVNGFGGSDYLSSLTITCGYPNISSNQCQLNHDCTCSIQKCEGPLNSGIMWLFDENNTLLTTPGFRAGSGKFNGGFFNYLGEKFTVYATCGAVNCDPNNPASCIPYIQTGKYGSTQIEAVQ